MIEEVDGVPVTGMPLMYVAGKIAGDRFPRFESYFSTGQLCLVMS